MKIKFVPQDLWVGVYFKKFAGKQAVLGYNRLMTGYRVYVCAIPCFPIIFDLWI